MEPNCYLEKAAHEQGALLRCKVSGQEQTRAHLLDVPNEAEGSDCRSRRKASARAQASTSVYLDNICGSRSCNGCIACPATKSTENADGVAIGVEGLQITPKSVRK